MSQFDSAVLSFQDMSAFYGQACLFEGVGGDVVSGELLHVTGSNGSGKSTLLRMIVGLRESDDGQVMWNKEAISVSERFHRDMRFVGHRSGLKLESTALENLVIYQEMYGAYEVDVEKTLLQVGLLELVDTQAKYLSFGQKQRLSLARLLLSPAPLWVLDEPFTGIDVAGRELIESAVLSHLQNNGMVVLTHHGDLDGSPLFAYRKGLAL